ncbi:MAG: HIT family protein [Candidatus Aenigmarchaeota archaeon]|nr:HIT family protein [Candidatus Aenigmarchaeota archaeon]
MTDCLFCKIASGEIPSLKVYETELFLAFLDINPCSKGHTVIIPKKHYQKLEEVPVEEAKEMFSFIYKLVKVVPGVVGTTDCNIGVNNGKFAGQEVPHLHFHIIPRFEGDKGIPIQGLVRVEVNKEELPVLAQKILTAMQNPIAQGSNKENPIEWRKPKEAKPTLVNNASPQQNKENTPPPQQEKEEKPTKSDEREWQEFNLKEQDKDIS